DERFGRRAARQIEAEEQLGVENGALLGEADTAPSDHQGSGTARLAAPGDAVRVGGEQGAQEGIVPIVAIAAGLPVGQAGITDRPRQLIPRLEDEPRGAGMKSTRIATALSTARALESFQSIEPVQDVGARSAPRTAPPLRTRAARKRIAFGEERGGEGCFAGITEAVPFDQQARQPWMDGHPGHGAADSRDALAAERFEAAQENSRCGERGGIGGLEPAERGEIVLAPGEELERRTG